MKLTSFASSLLLPLLFIGLSAGVSTAVYAEDNGIQIDVPVKLKEAKIVFNMDHHAFSGDTPVGLAHMTIMTERFPKAGTKWNLAAIFHGEAGYMLLNDESYDAIRKTKNGNPYKNMIHNLIEKGVQVEECGVTMKGNKWTNKNLLPGVKVNSGADARIVQLVQEGYVMLQP